MHLLHIPLLLLPFRGAAPLERVERVAVEWPTFVWELALAPDDSGFAAAAVAGTGPVDNPKEL